MYDGVPGTHQWYDGTPHPWEFKRVWHLEPSLTDPDTVYAGVEDAALTWKISQPAKWGPLTSHRLRLSSDVRTNAPLRVPTSTRTPLIPYSFLSFAPVFGQRLLDDEKG